jgi:hypothetical protein
VSSMTQNLNWRPVIHPSRAKAQFRSAPVFSQLGESQPSDVRQKNRLYSIVGLQFLVKDSFWRQAHLDHYGPDPIRPNRWIWAGPLRFAQPPPLGSQRRKSPGTPARRLRFQ